MKKRRNKLNRTASFTLILALISFTFPPVIPSQSTSQTAEQQFREIAPGVEYLQITRGHTSNDESTGPWLINVLRIDLDRAVIRFVRALDEAVGLETVTSLAMRHQAIAGVNGGYFRTTGTYRGESLGTYLLNRKLLSESHYDRAAAGLFEKRGKPQEIAFARLKYDGTLRFQNSSFVVNGINRPVAADEIVVFGPEFHRTTLTDSDGLEVLVRRGRITEIRDLQGSSEIPADGFVISASGKGRQSLIAKARKGQSVAFVWQLRPVAFSNGVDWNQAESIVAGGPQLIRQGKTEINNEAEKITDAFMNDRHPRTAIAKLRSGRLLLITVDGRQPGVSAGLSLPALAQLLLEFDSVDAINLDGGGSTAMFVRDKLVNKPSDATGERPVSDAIIVLTRPE